MREKFTFFLAESVALFTMAQIHFCRGWQHIQDRRTMDDVSKSYVI